jgi:dethiobiotin synthetase
VGDILFICGTDTDVGKTRVAGVLCAALDKLGIDFTFFKPFESGTVKKHGGRIIRPDTDFVCKMSGGRVQADDANLYAFREALAPGIAAARAGMSINWQRVIKTIRAASQKHRLVIVEGAGGLLVPLTGKKTISI